MTGITQAGSAQDGRIRNFSHALALPNMDVIEFNFTPELHLLDNRIIRNLEDAIGFAREQETRPGVDRRDEILHAMERASSREQAHGAAHQFVRWLEELEILA